MFGRFISFAELLVFFLTCEIPGIRVYAFECLRFIGVRVFKFGV